MKLEWFRGFFNGANAVYKTFKAILIIIGIMDMLDLPCMVLLDTTIPINGLAWMLALVLIPDCNDVGKVDARCCDEVVSVRPSDRRPPR